MNIGQLARNRQMMYKFINRSTDSGYQSQMRSQLSSMNGFGASDGAEGSNAANLLQSTGFSGLQGRTAREMAQYQMRVQNASAAQQTGTASGVSSPSRQFAARQQYAPISDEATEAMQKLALEDAKNSVGGQAADGAGRARLIREQLQNVDPSKRAASFNTMNKVWESEMDRIGKFIKEKNPGWNDWGDKFDTAILDDYKAGVNIWI